jgi:hypothetical protein
MTNLNTNNLSINELSINELINKYFKMPIEYCDDIKPINSALIYDLELLKSNTPTLDQDLSIYSIVFSPNTLFGINTLSLWSKYYTTNKSFLVESQKSIKSFKSLDNNVYKTDRFKKIYDIINDTITDKNFLDKYQYINSPWFKIFNNLNNNSNILQVLYYYNITSPLVSLLFPLILLIIPFFILKIYENGITIQDYIRVLKTMISNSSIGNLLFEFDTMTLEKKLGSAVSLSLYFYQIYENIKICFKFNENLKKIHTYLFEVIDYLNYTILSFDNYKNQNNKYSTFSLFIENMNIHKEVLLKYKTQLNNITPWKYSISKFLNIGQVMKNFYSLYSNIAIQKALYYSYGFHGYIDNILNIKNKYISKVMSACLFSKNKLTFKNAYHPSLINNPIKNSYAINKHMIISGPNASGKSTLLKTTLLNVLLSQQIGFGFYSKAKITIFDYLHCYLNIPDTSGRDSLFQSEARRCIEILDSINTNNSRHLCVFDELYSGTNPYEAISAATAYLQYMNKYPNIKYVLTTHYLELCKNLDKNKKIINYNMEIVENSNDFIYTYKLLKGISRIKGGIKVLKDLNYPEEIIHNTKKIMKNIIIN